MSDGAIDNDYADAEREPAAILRENHAETSGRGHEHLQAGDVALDLVTRQPLLVMAQSAPDLAAYYEETGFDLLTYKQHKFLPVTVDDAVFECVFVGGVEDLHKFSDTYDYPAGRLARVPVEIAGGDD